MGILVSVDVDHFIKEWNSKNVASIVLFVEQLYTHPCVSVCVCVHTFDVPRFVCPPYMCI